MSDALGTLARAGYTREATWAWGVPSGSDSRYACRVIADGVYIVLTYGEEAQAVRGMLMMYVPPDYSSSGNYRVLGVEAVVFNEDGSYTVAFHRPPPAAGRF